MNFIDVALSSWAPSANAHLFRRGPRHPMDRTWNYEDRYDFFAIIYDAFWSEDGSEIVLITPPPSNLEQEVFQGEYREVPSGKPVEPLRHQTGPIHIIRIPVSPGTQAIELRFSKGTYYISPQPNLCERLKGERLIVTISKNNALHWVRDWIYFHVKMHGCTGVIFYDNASDRYSKYDLRAALEPIPGLKYAILIDMPYPYGVNNGPFGVNDSRFLTRGILEHAKYRFARRAASLMHTDVDELVVTPTRESIFEATERSKTGYVSFEGIWVERVTQDGVEPPVEGLTHDLFRYVAAGGGRPSLRKTAIAPSRSDDRVFMTTHRAYGARPDYEQGDKFRHYHFIGLKTVATNVKNKERLDSAPFQRADPALHEVAPALAAQLDEVFGSAEYKALPKLEPYAAGNDADVCRRLAGIAMGRGDVHGAIEWVRRAIAMRPDYPSYRQFLANCLTEIGQAEEAAAEQKTAKALFATSPEWCAAESRKLRTAGDLDAAHTMMLRVVEENPSYADGRLEYGEVLNRLGRHEEAERAFARAVELNGNDPWLMWRWGSQLSRCGRDAEAVEVFQRLLALESAGFADLVRAYKSLTFSLERTGQTEEAARMSRVAIDNLGVHAKMTTRIRRDFESIATKLEHPGAPGDEMRRRKARPERPEKPAVTRPSREERLAAREQQRQAREATRGRKEQRVSPPDGATG